MITDLFTTTFEIKRHQYVDDGQGNQKSSLEVIEEFKGHRQQASQELVERFNLNFQTAFSIWCPKDTDIKVGDNVEDDTHIYSVRGVQVYDIGDNPHLEVAVEGGLKPEEES